MNTETVRIADQLRRAFAGEAWHGPPLRDLLSGVTSQQAYARPIPAWHNIWELALHIDVYLRGALEAAQGGVMPKIYQTEKDWSTVTEGNAAEWTDLTSQLLQVGERLADAVEKFDDSRLNDIVPGRRYDFYRLFHGALQHSLFHGGQIAMLKRALT